LFWDENCREEFLSILENQQKEFYSFWKELTPEVINLFIKDLSQQFYDQFEWASVEDKNSLGITLTEFEQEVGTWRKDSQVPKKSQVFQKYFLLRLVIPRKSNLKILQLRWNFEEFEVHLNQIKEMIPVNNYYLKILVNESFEEHNFPFLSEERVKYKCFLILDFRTSEFVSRNPKQVCEYFEYRPENYLP
jgi:hypothetical protein